MHLSDIDDPAHAAAVQALQREMMHVKRSLHLVRTSSGLHHRVTAAGVPLLGAIRRLGPQRTTALAAEFGLDPSTVSRQVDALVREGYLARQPDPDDGRAQLLALTDLGHTELAAHVDAVNAALAGLLDGWDVADLTTLTTLLGRLNDDVLARLSPQTKESR